MATAAALVSAVGANQARGITEISRRIGVRRDKCTGEAIVMSVLFLVEGEVQYANMSAGEWASYRALRKGGMRCTSKGDCCTPSGPSYSCRYIPALTPRFDAS